MGDAMKEDSGKAVGRRGAPRRSLLLIAALPWILACEGEKASPPPPPPVVATVNGEAISVAEFEKSLSAEMALVKREWPLTKEETAILGEEVLDKLIQERMMVQRARSLALSIGDAELDARVEEIRKDYDGRFDEPFREGGIPLPEWREALRKRMLLERLIALDVNAKIQVAEEEAERYYRAHRKAYATVRRVRVAQIVLPARDRAETVLKRLKAGEDFDKVAREVSIAPEAARGGDLGYFERGVMPEAIDRMVFSLPVGKISPVAKSPYGFHIFKVLGRAAAGGRKFADVKEKVVADLRKQAEAEAYAVWLDGLKAKAMIWINRPLPGLPGQDLESLPRQNSETTESNPPAVPEKR